MTDRTPIDRDDRRSNRCISRTCELYNREAYTTIAAMTG